MSASLPTILLFDLDGVLVDVRPSYHRVIIETVPLYLEKVLGLTVPPDLVGPEHVAALKRMGGFNNDWDLTAALLYVLVSHLPPMPSPSPAAGIPAIGHDPLHSADPAHLLRTAINSIFALEPRVRQLGGGLISLRALTGDRNAHAVLYHEWNPETNLVLRIYQERYLGPELMRQVYGLEQQYYVGPGLIDREERIISLTTVDALAQHHRLGIVTGRPRVEAEYALHRLGLAPYFPVLVTHDEVVEEMARRGTSRYLGKPHPWPLLQAASLLDPSGSLALAYVGDTGDDMRAAVAVRAARSSLAVGCTFVYNDQAAGEAELRSAGADLVVPHPDELLDLSNPGSSSAGLMHSPGPHRVE